MDSGRYVSIVNPHDSSAPPKTFCFDGVYYMDSTTDQIYSDIAYPLVEVRPYLSIIFHHYFLNKFLREALSIVVVLFLRILGVMSVSMVRENIFLGFRLNSILNL